MWEYKQPLDISEKEISDLLDKKKIKPSRRADLAKCIENVAEAISLGFVSISEDGSITQTLMTPVGTLETINFKARVDPSTINGKLSALKVETYSSRNMVYAQAYTGLLSNQINSMEPGDKETFDAIITFFL